MAVVYLRWAGPDVENKSDKNYREKRQNDTLRIIGKHIRNIYKPNLT